MWYNTGKATGCCDAVRLHGTTVTLDDAEYHIKEPDCILGIFVFMVREALERQGNTQAG